MNGRTSGAEDTDQRRDVGSLWPTWKLLQAAIEGLSVGGEENRKRGKYERGVLRFKKRKRERKNNTSMRRMGDQVPGEVWRAQKGRHYWSG